MQSSGCGSPHFLECVLKFSEVTLAVHFREKNAEGDLVGGPMYYIKNGLKKQLALAGIFVCGIWCTDGIWNWKCDTGQYHYDSN